MPQVSLLVQVRKPDPRLFRRMLDSVLNQSINDWELVLVVSDPADVANLAISQPNVRVEQRPEGELLAWSCNALLPTLGEWAGFLGQHDQLTPDAVETMLATLAEHPAAHVAYSDEEALGTWGQVSLQFTKRALDPLRLLSEEYLRDLVLIRTHWLASVGGFDPLASDLPTHDLYLRLLEQVGEAGFAHAPRILYRRHRNRLKEPDKDSRISPYLPRYDLDAVRRHFDRTGIPAKVLQWSGTLSMDFHLTRTPAVTVLVVLGDDVAHGKAQLAGVGMHPVYPHTSVVALFHGSSEQAYGRYREICAGLRYPLKRSTGNLPDALNQAIKVADTELTLVMQGAPLDAFWLKRLVTLLQLPGVTAAGPTLITPLHQLGGGSWDHRGHFNQLAVPHSVSVLSPACMLIDTRQCLELGGFAPEYPTLFGMDYTLRLNAGGGRCAITPRAHVQVTPTTPADPEELARFRTEWAGWEDPQGLHQLP